VCIRSGIAAPWVPVPCFRTLGNTMFYARERKPSTHCKLPTSRSPTLYRSSFNQPHSNLSAFTTLPRTSSAGTKLMRRPMITTSHSISLQRANECIYLRSELRSNTFRSCPVVYDQLQRLAIVVPRVPHGVLIYLYARPEGYSERTSQVRALLVPVSVRLGHMVGQSNTPYNHIINKDQEWLN